MKGKHFPQKSGKEVWTLLAQKLHWGSHGISMRGSLEYTDALDGESSSRPLFQLRLQPLRLDQTHRLERRFGSDRFFQIDIPNITGERIPKDLKDIARRGKTVVVDWLRSPQKLMGRTWLSFSNKSLRTKMKKRTNGPARPPNDNTVAHRIYFFAVDGNDFHNGLGTPLESETLISRSRWTINGLLNWVRPTLQNQQQPYLKLYARTALGRSAFLPFITS